MGSTEMIGLMDRAGTGELVRVVAKRRRRDGSLVDVQILGVPLVVNGMPLGSFGIYEDITERLRAEEAQRAAEEKYRRIFESAVEGFFESTPAGRFVTVNPAMARIAGYSSPAEMIGEVQDIARQLYVDPDVRKDVRRKLEENGILEGYECHMLRKDGHRIWISMNVRALRDASGAIVSHDGTAVEITERKRSELERQATTEITHAMSVTDNLDDLLRLIHKALNSVVPVDNCFVALVDQAAIVQYPFFVDRYDTQPAPEKMGSGCTAYVFRTGQPMLISADRCRQLIDAGEIKLEGTPSRSWLGVPLRTPSAKIGVLVVQHYERENAYTERDLEFLDSVGGQIAMAIERKRAEEKLRDSEARARVLIEQLPAVLWTVDTDLRFTSMLGAGLTRLGLKPNQLVGRLSPTISKRGPDLPADRRSSPSHCLANREHFTSSGKTVLMPATWSRFAIPRAKCRALSAWRSMSPTASSSKRSSARRRRWKRSADSRAESRTTSITC